MISINISKNFKVKGIDVALGIVQGEVQVNKSQNDLKNLMNELKSNIYDLEKIEDIVKLPNIYASREAYKTLGKKPARYRLSAEALRRRIIQGKGLYFVNNVVDIVNYVSLLSKFSIGLYDLEKIKEPINFTIGTKNDVYYGIGRGQLNIENLPVFEDRLGKFGSPTSDSERAKITNITKKIVLIIISFHGKSELMHNIQLSAELLSEYAFAKNIYHKIIN